MALTVPLVSGELLMLQYILGLASIKSGFTASTTDGPVIHLFSNNHTPGPNSVIANLNEVTTPGYAAMTLASANWAVSQNAGITTAVFSQQTFTFNTNGISFGYYVTNPQGSLLWLEEFSGAPFSIPDGGGTIAITLKITLA